jgi:hypothetical protein
MISWVTSLPFHIMAALPKECDGSFFGLPPWYKYVPMDYDSATQTCSVAQNFQILGNGTNSGLLLIGLAVVEIGLRLAALAAVAYVLWGGFTYLISQGEPEQTTKARHTILNALIGLVIAIIATALVTFVGNSLTA